MLSTAYPQFERLARQQKSARRQQTHGESRQGMAWGLLANWRLRSDSVSKDITILAFTALFDLSLGKSCVEAGCDDYAVKPVTYQVRQEKVQTLLDIRKTLANSLMTCTAPAAGTGMSVVDRGLLDSHLCQVWPIAKVLYPPE
jgi:hypothetical protein